MRRSRLRFSSRRGFTLLELTIAMMIVAVMIVTLIASLHTGFAAREVAENSTATNRSADLVLEIIRTDIESALPPTRGTFEQAFEGTQNNGDNFDRLDFFTTSPAAVHSVNGLSVGNGDIKEIVLTAYQPQGATPNPNGGPPTGVLVRRTWNNLLNTNPQYQPQYIQPDANGSCTGDEEVLCRNVVSLSFEYYDSNQQSWETSWDSTASQPVNTLPTAVQVTLVLESPDEIDPQTHQPKQLTYTRIFQLACIGASNSTSTTGTTGTTGTGGTQ
ncbi:MAG TPA: type II secretion system protein GspJ [Tepidisphaeraceae bacterium]|nr:type II secretion system protein GspJ [Tepidisphaeraceae bacterium]